MAIIGFFALLVLGVIFSFAALAGACVLTGFAGRVEWPHFLTFGGIGGALLYAAFTNCPFSIVIG